MLAFSLTPEALNAIIIAAGGALSAFIVAYVTARRQAKHDDSDGARAFRGELRDDNQTLRQEMRELKKERDRLQERADALEKELRHLYDNRLVRQASDQAAEGRRVELLNGNGK